MLTGEDRVSVVWGMCSTSLHAADKISAGTDKWMAKEVSKASGGWKGVTKKNPNRNPKLLAGTPTKWGQYLDCMTT